MQVSIPSGFEILPPDSATDIISHTEAESALLDSYCSGRLHHAWLIDGPRGCGKATLAYRFARFLLSRTGGRADTESISNLSIPADSLIARQIRAKAHPDLFVLERARDDEGRAIATTVPVEAVRRVARFLSTTSSTGGWRVVIVDTADDLNRSSANALLKMLEEPPQKAVFLLLSNSPGRLLATIRSRCRRLRLKPLSKELIFEALRLAGIGADDDTRHTAASLAAGSLGRAIELADEDAIDTVKTVHAILDAMPRHDPVATQAFAERLGRRGSEERYRTATILIVDWIAEKTIQRAHSGAGIGVLAPWAEVWEKVSRALAETERLNLDRTLTLLSVFRIVSAAASHDVARV